MNTTMELVTQNHMKVGYTGEVLRTKIYTSIDREGVKWVTASVSYRGITSVYPRHETEGVMEEIGAWLAGKAMPIVLGMQDYLAEG